MKDNFTSINVVIDRSGSMSHLASDTIGSFNGFIADQKNVPGDAVFTLCTFNSNHEMVYDFVPLNNVPNLTAANYSPSGGTALLDAIGITIDSVGAKLAAMPEEERPSKVIFIIITDGEENSSRLFNKEQVKAKVELQRNTYSWEFVFMGANIDAISAGTSLGVSATNSMNYSATRGGTRKIYQNTSDSLKSFRTSSKPIENFFDRPIDISGIGTISDTPIETVLDTSVPVKRSSKKTK